MVRSGKNPLAQLVKRLSELHATKLVEATRPSDICTMKPNNVFILDNTSCCQVLEKTNQFNADGDLLYKCRVYKLLNPAFDHPCDSHIVNVFETSNRWTKIDLLSFARFEQKGLMCETGETIIFMAILRTV